MQINQIIQKKARLRKLAPGSKYWFLLGGRKRTIGGDWQKPEPRHTHQLIAACAKGNRRFSIEGMHFCMFRGVSLHEVADCPA